MKENEDSQNGHKSLIAQKSLHPDGTQTASVTAEVWSAPIPHPDVIEKYEKILPGSADRIIKKFESQTEHRQRCEVIFVKTESLKSLGGLIAAFIIAMTTIIGGIILTVKGENLIGGGSIFIGLATLVGPFITDRIISRKKEKETEE